MTTITAQKIWGTRSNSLLRSTKVLAAAIVVVAAAVALTVWMLVQSPSHHASTTTPGVSSVQQPGVAGQGGSDLCQPAAGQRFC